VTFTVQDFDKLHEIADTFSVRPGGHGSLPDIWILGANFPIVSARLRAILEDAFPDGSYFFPCPVYERVNDAPPMSNWMKRDELLAGGPLGADAPQNFSYWVIRNKLMFRKPPGWKRPRSKPRHPVGAAMDEMAANPAVGKYMAQMPICRFLPTDVFHRRTLCNRIRAAGMTGYSEARGHTINRGENTAHL
jgi:hypothetical protein